MWQAAEGGKAAKGVALGGCGLEWPIECAPSSARLSLSLPPGLALDQDKLQKMRKRATRVSTLNNCRALAVTATVSLFSHMRLIVREGALGKVAVRERGEGRRVGGCSPGCLSV